MSGLNKVSRADLVQTHLYIGGEWTASASGKKFPVTNPSCGAELCHVADGSGQDVVRAIDAAEAALPEWSDHSPFRRAEILKSWHRLILDNSEDLALIMTLEQGKPLKEAKGEIDYGASFVEWFAEEAKRIDGDLLPAHLNEAQLMVLKEPVGIVGAITPWNFPYAMITRKIAPALAAGCTVILKPASDTPLSALALAVLAEEAGLPAGVLNIITGTDSGQIGEKLTEDTRVRKIAFTGSTSVGRKLYAQSADTIKKISLELGGNAPFIVFESAALDTAADAYISAKFRNTGQTCVAPNRLYVQNTILDDFVAILTEKMKALRCGDGLDPANDIGPLINKKGLEKVEAHIKDACDKGAKILLGGKLLKKDSLYFPATLLINVNDNMDMSCEETFGPVAAIMSFENEDEVVRRGNNTPYGLASYFCSGDERQKLRVARRLEAGMIGVNSGRISAAHIPFGGIKQSGLGREGSKYGIAEFLELKYVLVTNG